MYERTVHRRRDCLSGAADLPADRATETGAILMTLNGYLQLLLYIVALIGLAKPLGWFMARVYQGQPVGIDRVLGPVERLIYRLCGTRSDEEMSWKTYTIAMLLFNLVGFLFLYALQRLQKGLPLNPQGL